MDILKPYVSTFITGVTNLFTDSKLGTERNKLIRDVIAYGILLFILFIVYFVMMPDTNTMTSFLYGSIILCSVILVLYITSPIAFVQGSLPETMSRYNVVLGIVLFFMTFFLTMYKFPSSAVTAIHYIVLGLVFLFFIVGLAIVFYMFSNHLRSLTGYPAIAAFLLFYLPCLITDFVAYIVKECRLTTPVIYILLGIEAVLIGLYLLLPALINYIVLQDGISLLSGATYLDKQVLLAPVDQMRYIANADFLSPTTFTKSNYAISMWIYTNALPNSNAAYATHEVNVINYAGVSRITYVNNPANNTANTYNFYVTNNTVGDMTPFRMELLSQKWNNVVFNCNSTRTDIFINGVLMYSRTFESNPPIYSRSDMILGSDQGVSGAICNIKYYPAPLKKSQITAAYNSLMKKNPPINILW